MERASVKRENLKVRSQTCGVLGEGTLQKEKESSMREGSAVGKDLFCWGKSKEAGVAGEQ